MQWLRQHCLSAEAELGKAELQDELLRIIAHSCPLEVHGLFLLPASHLLPSTLTCLLSHPLGGFHLLSSPQLTQEHQYLDFKMSV